MKIGLKKNMKNLINKLFEWLGYAPDDTIKHIYMRVDWAHKAVFNQQTGIYHIEELKGAYMVGLLEEYSYTYLAIKLFPFGDDKEYARLCANELCEMLNQKI